MYRLSDPAIEAILKEWRQKEYDPSYTDVREWTHAVESLCDTYGIPDTQRPECAAKFIKSELRTELENVLRDARTRFGPIHWAQFTNFMAEFDRNFKEIWEQLPFYKKHPKRTAAALGVTGSVLLAPIPVVGALTAVGFTSTGIAAGSIAATIQSIVYGGVTGGLFSLLQSAGATMVLPSVGTIFAGAASTGAGIAIMKGESVSTSEILTDSIARGHQPGGDDGSDDDGDGKPPSYHQAVPQEYLLTPQAVQAIVKSWNITAYNPPGMNVAGWLGRVGRLCETYEVPVTQQALCAMHHMRADCREAARAAECYDMTWDQFTTWLLQYDGGG
ncbi:hypothetical protein BDM02DRAFT_3120353 [Thelephora ganbajun]|uniref:Uncharacterized protein n=1 Tax=Thelephora ganbajun TaxID=370292 RepID=A0ACB6Z857_THEGA|nr:hypothetical protein BDM02DRAFT_3120353 [Thelephora ganbajun]